MNFRLLGKVTSDAWIGLLRQSHIILLSFTAMFVLVLGVVLPISILISCFKGFTHWVWSWWVVVSIPITIARGT